MLGTLSAGWHPALSLTVPMMGQHHSLWFVPSTHACVTGAIHKSMHSACSMHSQRLACQAGSASEDGNPTQADSRKMWQHDMLLPAVVEQLGCMTVTGLPRGRVSR